MVLIESGQPHPREERNRAAIVLNEPLKVLLKHILTFHTESLKQGIQPGLGGSGLPATIKQFHPGFTDSSNQVAVQVDIRNVGEVDHLSVGKLEVFVVLNGLDHLGFDLTHCGLESDWWWKVSSPPDVAIIRWPEALHKGACDSRSTVTRSEKCYDSDGSWRQSYFNTFQIQSSELCIDTFADQLSGVFETGNFIPNGTAAVVGFNLDSNSLHLS